MGDVREARHGPTGRDGTARARSAARHAERLYPGVLGRLVARELLAWAESGPGPAGSAIVESVITEVLDQTAPRAAG